ncbi:MAG TPA: hypothetical protein VNW26_00600 [Steroidobacteraceae bacterium]|nr:hypothetical protein [Steroidobacteraceae bacterium]
MSGGFPDGIVEIRRAFAKSSVKLGGDEARLALHESRVVNGLSDGLPVKEIETVHRVVTALRKKLEGGDEPDERG